MALIVIILAPHPAYHWILSLVKKATLPVVFEIKKGTIAHVYALLDETGDQAS